MPGEERTFTATIGLLVQNERARQRLSQARLAELVGTSQQWLSRLERGTAAPTTVVVERVLAALGLQPRIEVDPLGADLDPEIDRHLAMSEDERVARVEAYGRRFDQLAELPYVLSGRLAAFVQGAPVAVRCLDLVVAEAEQDRIVGWLESIPCQRWNERWLDWGYDPVDPRRPGPLRWRVGNDEIRLEIYPARPVALTVHIGQRELRVRPLWELERELPDLGRLMRRVRALAALTGAA
jgi:transcriptional regulator with XRE-family HTH domain